MLQSQPRDDRPGDFDGDGFEKKSKYKKLLLDGAFGDRQGFKMNGDSSVA